MSREFLFLLNFFVQNFAHGLLGLMVMGKVHEIAFVANDSLFLEKFANFSDSHRKNGQIC